MTGLILVRDPYTGAVIRSEAPEPQPLSQDTVALLDTATDEVIRLRRLLLEVASLGIVTDEDRVGPAAAGHHWLECPKALWDQIEEEVARG